MYTLSTKNTHTNDTGNDLSGCVCDAGYQGNLGEPCTGTYPIYKFHLFILAVNNSDWCQYYIFFFSKIIGHVHMKHINNYNKNIVK